MEPYKRDLPEIVAEILIEQHAMREDINALHTEMTLMREEVGGLREDVREEIGGLREDVRESSARMENSFSVMTNAILDAMNRQTSRYDATADEVADLRRRVQKLENQAGQSLA